MAEYRYESIKKILADILDNYNVDKKQMNLVMFDDCLNHLTRVHRIIRMAKPRNPRNVAPIEGGRVYALHIDLKSVLDALCRVKKCLRRSMRCQKVF